MDRTTLMSDRLGGFQAKFRFEVNQASHSKIFFVNHHSNS